MKRKVIGLVVLGLVATAWGQQAFIDRENAKHKLAELREEHELRQYERDPEDPSLLALYYLSCSQSVDRVERELENYRLSEASVQELSATEVKYYNEELTNRMQVVAMKKQELSQVKEKMTQDSWKEATRILEERQREIEEAKVRIKIKRLKANELKPKVDLRAQRQNANTSEGANTLRERRRLRREREIEKPRQVNAPKQKTELDLLRDVINEFQEAYKLRKDYCSNRSLENQWDRPTSHEVSALEKQGFSNEVCILAFDYLTCTQKVEEAQKDLVDYKLNEASFAQLTAEETNFYQNQISNRIARLEDLQMAFEKVNAKMPPSVLAAIPVARTIRKEKKRLIEEGQRLANETREMEQKFCLLREGHYYEQSKPFFLAEDINGLNVSNLVIQQICRTPHSAFRGIRVFSYALTIMDGRITKIEELPEKKLSEKPIIPVIMEKNK